MASRLTNFIYRQISSSLNPSSHLFRNVCRANRPPHILFSYPLARIHSATYDIFIKSQRDIHDYEIKLFTADEFGAGTDARVFLRMIGENGTSEEIQLPTTKKDLERGKIDVYHVETDFLGKIKKLIIRHDNTGFAPAWYVKKAVIRDSKGNAYNFSCNQWLRKVGGVEPMKLFLEDNISNKQTAHDDKAVESVGIRVGLEEEVERVGHLIDVQQFPGLSDIFYQDEYTKVLTEQGVELDKRQDQHADKVTDIISIDDLGDQRVKLVEVDTIEVRSTEQVDTTDDLCEVLTVERDVKDTDTDYLKV